MNQTIKKRIEEIKQGKVPEGYKLTKSGVLPFSWDSLELGKLVSPIQEKAHNNKFEVLSITAGIGFVNQTDKFGMVIAGAQYQNYIVLRKGDFSYNKGNSKTYPQGCIYMLEDRDEAAVPSVFISFRFKPEIHTYYYKHLFINGFLNRQLYRYINAGVRNDGLLNLYNDDFYGCEIPVPSLPEQHKIAKILSTWDKAIELKEKLIEEKKRQKKWLLENLLNPKSGVKLPGFEGEWEVKTIGDVVLSIVGGGTPPRDVIDYYEGDIPWATVKDLGNDFYKGNTIEHISAQAIHNNTTKIIPKGSFIISTRMGLGKGFINTVDMAINQDLKGLRLQNYVNIVFFAYWYKSGKWFQKFCSGSTVQGIDLRTLKRITIQLPPLKEQTAIADILSTADKEINLLEQELEQLQKQKKALMQLLLTGIVRVRYNST